MFKWLSKRLSDWLTHETPSKELPLCDFERIRHELKPGDVLLIEGRSRVSEVIRVVTQSPWSHASLYIGRLHDIEDPALREKITAFQNFDPNTQLVVESYLGRGTIVCSLDMYKTDHIRICRPQGLSRRDALQVMAFTIRKIGAPYDVRQVIDMARFLVPWSFLPRRWRSSLFEHHIGESTRTVCSTMIAEAFSSIDFPILPVVRKHEQNGIELVHRNHRLFTPSDFDYSPYFEIIKFPYVPYSESPYRQLPWNKELFSRDGFEVHNPADPVKLPRKRRFKKKIPVAVASHNEEAVPALHDESSMTEKVIDKSSFLKRLSERFYLR
jgi:hypothetical protein